jgi:hypothetical protein
MAVSGKIVGLFSRIRNNIPLLWFIEGQFSALIIC